MFHREGQKIILTTFFVVCAITLLAHFYIAVPWLKLTLQIASLVILILILQFFRNPKRKVIKNFDDILAPVDGKVVVIEEVEESEYFKDKRIQVSIFMSPINVHVTRYAASGSIVYSKYHPGKYLVAWHP
ncbi:MAG: phosphatidylserine decarboxylase, partial [Bacteroidota bacterium]